MKRTFISVAVLVAACFLSSCAVPKPSTELSPQSAIVPIEKWQITLVTAKNVVRLGEVGTIADIFTFEGRIHVHATLTSSPGSKAGAQSFEVHWVNGTDTVAVQKTTVDVSKTPYYISSSTSGTVLKAGYCRVELYAAGRLLATKNFLVTER